MYEFCKPPWKTSMQYLVALLISCIGPKQTFRCTNCSKHMLCAKQEIIYLRFCAWNLTLASSTYIQPLSILRGNANVVSGHWQRVRAPITNTQQVHFTSNWPIQVLLRLWTCIHSHYNSTKADLGSGFLVSILIKVSKHNNTMRI